MSFVLHKKGMFKNLIRSALSLGFMKVVHIKLPDKGGKIVMLKVLW